MWEGPSATSFLHSHLPPEGQASPQGSHTEMEETAYCQQLTPTRPVWGHSHMHTHSPPGQRETMGKAL